jgi:hypothetical protein
LPDPPVAAGYHGQQGTGSLLEFRVVDAQLEDAAAGVGAEPAELAKQEVLEDTLTDLATDLRAGDAAEPAVVRSRWEKVKGLLGGVAQFSELVAKISDQVQKIFT